MTLTAKRQNWALAAWLLVCPLLLIAAVYVLPRFNQFHGTAAERITLLTLMSLPVAGAVGILRHVRASKGVRLALSACYLVAGLVIALLAVIFVGCSWARACF